ncbi:hypothetical protein AVEN_95475-1 [Araneus ventricosus]|uniref:Uncharacterized protein n=1 Tax=Araneus ventricosus TaxID=182803 RepID=A0A4Y2KUJ3_ARAVE|nr:hypothetical protein AVEN_95475-1 [Araneus ventricosus]
MNHGEVSLAIREVKYSPYCFVAAEVSPHLIVVDHLGYFLLRCKNTAVSDPSLTYLLTYLIDFTELQYSYVDMRIENFYRQRAVRYNPRIVHKHFYSPKIDICSKSPTYDIVDTRPVLFVFVSKNGLGICLCKFHPSYM